MKINFIHIHGVYIAELTSGTMEIRNSQDALDLLANCSYQGASRIIIYEANVISDFFDLKTGLAGEILQKFSSYNVKLAIVGDFTKYQSKSLKDFIYESNKTGRINFVNNISQAKEALVKNEK
jgi:hypothetical protein